MIWNNVELFNVAEIETCANGGIYMRKFPTSVMHAFDGTKNTYAPVVSRMTTACEIRFVGKGADITLSSDANGTVEIYRGDFLCRVEWLPANEVKTIALRDDAALDKYAPNLCGRFSSDVWRVVFDHDFCGVLHEFKPLDTVRPPLQTEVPKAKILAYGSSITHSAGAVLYTNSYIYTVGKTLGADVLCKGMGGSCHIEKEVADYLFEENWDFAVLELGINMVTVYPVEVFEQRAEYLIKKLLTKGKPILLISNYTSFHNLPKDEHHAANADYVRCLESIYQRLKTENLYYIRGQEIVTEWEYLTADLLHPSPYGHGEMGRKIAKKIREELKIL